MRHTIAENINVLGKFGSGDTVTISLYKISDESVVGLDNNSCNEIGSTGVFKWNSSNITTPPTEFTEYLWVMNNSTYAQYGKIVLGGYPEGINDIKGTGFVKDTDSLVDIRPETDKIQTGIIDVPNNYKNTEEEIKTAIDNYVNKDTYKATGFATENPPSQNLADYKADVSEILLVAKRTLGLIHENYRLFDLQYDANDSLTSATIKIYPTATDCNNNTNPLAEYTLTATYTGEKLDTYKVVKV